MTLYEPITKILIRCQDEVEHVVLRCTDVQQQKLLATKSEVELMAALHVCAVENAFTPPCPKCRGRLERTMADEPWSTAV